ncbi:hypothetical protein A262_17169 [Pseudomonas syringae pv. actinidiae ICMP 19073]|nr:hypothetical protein A262_17169 [Pseudomonas syringae pv. actinidiae ICMP 19073]
MPPVPSLADTAWMRARRWYRPFPFDQNAELCLNVMSPRAADEREACKKNGAQDKWSIARQPFAPEACVALVARRSATLVLQSFDFCRQSRRISPAVFEVSAELPAFSTRCPF